MKLAHLLSVLGLATAASIAGIVACGDDEATTGNEPGKPPAKPSAGATTSTTQKNFAVKNVFIGDRPRSGGGPDKEAWKKFGYNIDGKTSTATSEDGCKPPRGGPTTVKEDGDNGIDNSFGANIVPIVTTANAEAASVMNKTIADGKFTLMLYIKGLTEETNQTATGLSGVVLTGADLKKPAAYGKDVDWPVRPETLSNKQDPASSTLRLPDSYIVNGQFVANADVDIKLVFGGNEVTLALKKGVVTFDHRGTKADNGTLAGVVRTSELVSQLRRIRGNISPSLCGSLFDTIAEQIEKTSDIMADGSSGTAAQECDGISLGIGFTAEEIGAPKTVGPAATVVVDACAADGGADGG